MLAELCEIMEHDYGLQQDNHTPRRRGAESRAADMERHVGIESLIGWIKRECLDDIKAAQSWGELHQIMRNNGLELRTRGNWLVVVAGDVAMVKASTLGRGFSKQKLEARFGPFEPGRALQPKPHRRYRKDPIQLRVNTTELYARYKAEQQRSATNKTAALNKARREKDRQIANAKTKGKARRAAIKLVGGGRLTKKLLYAQASSSLKAEIGTIQKKYRAERQKVYDAYRRLTWADWLKQQALQGDSEALTALRARGTAQDLKCDTINGSGQAKPDPSPVIDSITKKGTIIFRVGSSEVRDDGGRLQVSRGATLEVVQNALHLAMERYGQRISVDGSPEFKALVIKAAVNSQLPISFAEPDLERRRHALMTSRAATATKANTKRPDIPPVGLAPPPDRRHKWLTLSQINTLHFKNEAAKASIQSEQGHRRAKILAEPTTKRAKRQRDGRGRSR